MKVLNELAALRFRVLILTAAIIIALGYVVFFIFRFYKLAGSVINYAREFEEPETDEEPEEEQPEPKPEPQPQPQMAANEN